MANWIKIAIGAVAGLVVGILLTAVIGWTMMPGMMIHEHKSPYDLDKTVDTITANAEENGWSIPKIYNFQKTIKEEGYDDVGRIKVIEMCQPEIASGLLKNPENKRVAVMMPCAIAVYEKDDGVYVANMNVGMMGKMFGGEIATAMGRVAADDEKIMEFMK